MVVDSYLLDQSLPVSVAGTTCTEALLNGPEEVPSAPVCPTHWHDEDDPSYDSTLLLKADWRTNWWLDKAKEDLKTIGGLPGNWDSYGSPPLSRKLLENAKEFIDCLETEDITPPFVAPVSGGGVQFEWCYNNRELEVEFLEADVIGYLKVIDDNPVEEGEFSSRDYDLARRLVAWLMIRNS